MPDGLVGLASPVHCHAGRHGSSGGHGGHRGAFAAQHHPAPVHWRRPKRIVTEVTISPQVHGDARGQRTIGDLHVSLVVGPAALELVEVLGHVLELVADAAPVLAEDAEAGLPAVRQIGVQRLVVKGGHHLGHGRPHPDHGYMVPALSILPGMAGGRGELMTAVQVSFCPGSSLEMKCSHFTVRFLLVQGTSTWRDSR